MSITMEESKTKLKSHYHCVFDIKYYLVLVTKYRKKIFRKSDLDFLETLFREQLNLWDCELNEFGGEEDHVHLLLSLHPNVTPAKLIGSLKTVTSRLYKKHHAEHFKKFYWEKSLWTRAYCLVSCGGAPLDIVKSYIQNQGRKKVMQMKKKTSKGLVKNESIPECFVLPISVLSIFT